MSVLADREQFEPIRLPTEDDLYVSSAVRLPTEDDLPYDDGADPADAGHWAVAVCGDPPRVEWAPHLVPRAGIDQSTVPRDRQTGSTGVTAAGSHV